MKRYPFPYWIKAVVGVPAVILVAVAVAVAAAAAVVVAVVVGRM